MSSSSSSSSSSEDEVESIGPFELSDYESEWDSQPDPHDDSNYESDTDSEVELRPLAWHHTMAGPSCGLCRFEFAVHEEFVVYNPVSQRHPRIWNGEYEPGYDQCSAIELGFHHGCVDLLKPKTLVNDWPYALSSATAGRQDYLLPPVSWNKHRERWYKNSIAADLTQAIRGRLPQEICQYIASFCMRERACLNFRDLWLDPARPKGWLKLLTIERNKSVWAQNMEVEGLRYVRSLSTRRLTKQDTLVYKARYRKRSARNRPEACLNIYYSEDHGGIRDVIITENNELPTLNMEPGLSWSIFRHQKTPLRVKQNYKVTRLRFLRFSPTPQFDRTRLYYESVRAVDWNSPGVCGYSFYVEKNLIRGIVLHKLGEPEPKARDEYDTAEETWFYMPIDPNERVSELWRRKGMDHLGTGEIETLIVRTTKGRTFTAGIDAGCSDPVDGTLNFTYKAIAIFPQEGTSRMFYCRANWMWEYLVFEQQQQHGLGNKGDLQGVVSWDQHEVQHSFAPPNNPLTNLTNLDCFVYTSASLNDVRTIAPCRGWSAVFHDQIVGMLLTYGDGRRRSVGQVRLDCLDPPLSVSSDCFWLGFPNHDSNKSGDWLPWYLKATSFQLSEPMPNNSTTYIKVPFSGRLEWAVLDWESAVRHVEEGEPFDEIGQVMPGGRKEVLEPASPEIKTFAVPIRVKETSS
ncbi:uncharacterized protein FSUBG_4225 [Fusarium subglutinans]|uniref:Uncharacterized protein n=1 Tax=Gibberella subglutinans TaxID=42677 RepID=A0A8H5Q3Z0_GIBSU|nr:uncharacterized protein FSUBG_4225 [Fusarium subglutinans]KAF5609070.1 hypothetical protein FSUBG_4225 [Fusarium subglutinans]